MPQRVFELCPFHPVLSNTFFHFFRSFLIFIDNSLIILHKKSTGDDSPVDFSAVSAPFPVFCPFSSPPARQKTSGKAPDDANVLRKDVFLRSRCPAFRCSRASDAPSRHGHGHCTMKHRGVKLPLHASVRLISVKMSDSCSQASFGTTRLKSSRTFSALL